MRRYSENGSRNILELGKDKKEIKLRPAFDILGIGGKSKPKRTKFVLKIRKDLEKKYQRF